MLHVDHDSRPLYYVCDNVYAYKILKNTKHNSYLSSAHKLVPNSLSVNFPSQQHQQRISKKYNAELSQ